MNKKFLQILTLATLSTLFTNERVIAVLDPACIERCDELVNNCKSKVLPHYAPNQRESHRAMYHDHHHACTNTCMSIVGSYDRFPPPYEWPKAF